MKKYIPMLCLLSACADPGLSTEIAALRKEVAELRAVEQPTFDAVLAMEELSREVRRLRETKLQPDAPAALPAPALAPPLTLSASAFVGGVGGTAANTNDLFWVLAKVNVDGADRIVLAQYKATTGNSAFRLNGVRMLGADLQILEYAQDKPHVREVLEELKKKK